MYENIKNMISNGENIKNMSIRKILSNIKYSDDIQKEVIKATSFLDEYEPTINERSYYILNDLDEIVKCPYCGEKANWNARDEIKKAYGQFSICKKKECKSKAISKSKEGTTKISENRDKDFIEWQKSVTYIDDDIIKEHIKYDKFISLIDNEIILNYLNNRFTNSYSIKETLQRIEMHIEKKPLCANPNCNNPVKWIGRKRALYTTFCCDSCAATSDTTRDKCRKTNKENWSSENVYDSDAYKQKCIEEFGKPFIWQKPEYVEKANKTKMEKYGTIYPSKT